MADKAKTAKNGEYEQMKAMIFHDYDIAVKTNVDDFRMMRKNNKNENTRANYFHSGGVEFALKNLIKGMGLENEYFEYLKSKYLGDELNEKTDMAKDEFQSLM